MSNRAHVRRPLLAAAAVAGLAAGLNVAPAAAADSDAASPKNIILLISDGAGYHHFDIVNLFESGTSLNQVSYDPATGVLEREPSTPHQVYDHYPVQVGQAHFAASGRAEYVTESAWGDFDWVRSGATDSAAAATALGTGVKTTNGRLGIDPQGDRLLTVGEQALAVDKKVGLVTSVTFPHATPAGFIAHNESRNNYREIASEMIDSGVDVIIGAGHPHFTNDNTRRAASYSVISESDFERVSTGQTPFTYVEEQAGFEAIAAGDGVPDKLFGLAQVADTLQFNRSRTGTEVVPWTDERNDVPSLATLTDAALNVLEQGDDGFFLMVEGGAVDWAGHANDTTGTLEEQIEFNEAAEAVDAWVEAHSSWDETLVIVTSDHETGYLAGAGSADGTAWTPMTGEAGEVPEVTWHSGSHTNALVPLFAKGAGSELLASHADQWDIVYGPYLDNTAVGETIFDLLGHAAVADHAVGLEADVRSETTAGDLSLTVPTGPRVAFDGSGPARSAALPEIVVQDTRPEVQAQGGGWTVSGTGSDFVAGNRTIGAEHLSWTPAVVSSDSGADAGPTASLDAPAPLADAGRVSRVGTTVVGADLALEVPADATSGRYASEITLTLFAKD